jgi:hypothetical protein
LYLGIAVGAEKREIEKRELENYLIYVMYSAVESQQLEQLLN